MGSTSDLGVYTHNNAGTKLGQSALPLHLSPQCQENIGNSFRHGVVRIWSFHVLFVNLSSLDEEVF